MSTLSHDQDLATTWEIRARTNPDTGEPLPLSQASPLLYFDDQPLLALDPTNVVEIQRALKVVKREQSGKAHVFDFLHRTRLGQWLTDRRHAARLWRARHPVLGLVVHGRTVALAPIALLVVHGFVVTAGA